MTDLGPRRIRAARCMTLDGPDAIRIEEIESPAPRKGEARLRLEACGVNFPDLLMTRGLYQHRAEPPFIPGLEAAGEVLDLGEGVEGWAPGDRAAVLVTPGGAGFAEEITVPVERLLPIPPSIPAAEAATLFVGHYTAWNGLIDRGGLKQGETLVVFGAGGGVGLAAAQIGLAMGAKVIAVASSPEKRARLAEDGVRHLLDPADPKLREKIKEIAGGEGRGNDRGVGVDMVYDPVNGALFETGLRVLRPEGRMVVIGFAGGDIRPAPSNIVLIKEISVIGVRAGEYGRRHPERRLQAWKTLCDWHVQGKVRPHVWKTFPLERAADALKALEDRAVIGKVAVTMG